MTVDAPDLKWYTFNNIIKERWEWKFMRNFRPVLSLILAVECFILLRIFIHSTLLVLPVSIVLFLVFLILTQRRSLPGGANMKKIDMSKVDNKGEAQKTLRESAEKMRKIKLSIPKLHDSNVRTKVDEIYRLGEKIFAILEKDPSQISTVRRFFTYYLDTAIKLIDQYLFFKKTSKDVRSISLEETTGKIAASLDLVIESFQTQIDKLLQNDVMSIEADISVLETMIESEKL